MLAENIAPYLTFQMYGFTSPGIWDSQSEHWTGTESLPPVPLPFWKGKYDLFSVGKEVMLLTI